MVVYMLSIAITHQWNLKIIKTMSRNQFASNNTAPHMGELDCIDQQLEYANTKEDLQVVLKTCLEAL